MHIYIHDEQNLENCGEINLHIKSYGTTPLQFTMHHRIPLHTFKAHSALWEKKCLVDGSSHVICALQGVGMVKESWMIVATLASST
jgi:hypothetical protein